MFLRITDFNTVIFSVDFVPHASMDTAHHMILYGCKTPYATQGYWDCGKELGTCRDQAKIMYAWARNAPPTKLPKDVGFKVGGDTRINYFVLQIHYGDATHFRDHHRDCSGLTLRMTSKPQPFIAGMYLMMSVDTVIPPGKKVTNADIACTYTSSPMYPFAFRTHTHSLGKVVSGYRVRNGQWTQIGRQSPLLPQAFYPVANTIDVRNGDILAARCVFTGEGRTTNTQIGGTSNDEMCNFYIMYYMDNSHAVPYMNCGDDGSSELFRNIPSEANIPIPVSPDHMMSMKHESAPQKDVVELQEPKREEEVLDQGAHLVEVSDWPEADLQLGQVSGLALNSKGDLIIFHRGDHVWGINSFINGIYQQKDLGPIQQSTIMVVDPAKGKVLKASGRNMFYMPHGITTDKDDNYWLTDVALHQVKTLKSRNSYLKRRVPFWIPHSLAFLPDKRELCCFMADTGEFVKEIKKDQFGGEVFAIAYSPAQGIQGRPVTHCQTVYTFSFLFLFDICSVFPLFFLQEFKLPHDIVVTADGSVFVGDAASDSVIKFVLSTSKSCLFSFSHTGKAAGSLNLGNFFATHKGYTRHGFDRLSTEGSDLEKDEEDGTDSENEEYTAPPAPMSSS
uniref:peptidylglycine monooxygenase n=1 Tax=Cyprinus carpio TaxID=7962 RepID=A0A8C1YAY2_CYPCA